MTPLDTLFLAIALAVAFFVGFFSCFVFTFLLYYFINVLFSKLVISYHQLHQQYLELSGVKIFENMDVSDDDDSKPKDEDDDDSVI